MFLFAFVVEMLITVVFILLFGADITSLSIVLFLMLAWNIVAYLLSHTFILNRLNCETIRSNDEFEIVDNVSFKFKGQTPKLYKMSDFPYDLVVLAGKNNQLIMAIGTELMNVLSKPEMESLMSNSISVGASRLRYHQWLVVKMQLIYLILFKLLPTNRFNGLFVAIKTVLISRIHTFVLKSLKNESLIPNQNILVKLNRKKEMVVRGAEMSKSHIYLSLSMTETHESELIPLLT